MKRCLPLALLVVGLVGCDHGTKLLAEHELRGQAPVAVVDRLVQLDYTENRDIGFSLLRTVPEDVRLPLVLFATSAMVIALGVLAVRRRRAVERIALGVVLAGALGNFLDRVVRGYVIDFVRVPHWPVFNVADVWIAIGVGLLLWFGWRGGQGESRRSDVPAQT
jgi:signal peptidase II